MTAQRRLQPAGSGASMPVFVVDDDRQACDIIGAQIRRQGPRVRTFYDGRACLDAMADDPPALVITDISMPGLDGLALLKQVRAKRPGTDVIVVTGRADKDTAIRALKLGAFDFFEKPVTREELLATLARTLAYRTALQERDRLSAQLSFAARSEASKWGLDAFVGTSKTIQKVLRQIRLLQNAENMAVLITGESGTGKELIARAIHYGSTRSDQPFVPVNCAAIPAELAESCLFGHRRGAFTGAVADRKGVFELAHGGTVFLDEIGEMAPALQAKLLRVLEDGEVTPVGAVAGRAVNARIIAATNADLKVRIDKRDFRADLFYRLAGFTLQVPPLRERCEDIPLLARHFLRRYSADAALICPEITDAALADLQAYAFPGNVRELKNLMERALVECGAEPIAPRHLFFHARQDPPAPRAPLLPGGAPNLPADLPFDLQTGIRLLVERAILHARGNLTAAARLLGISRTRIYRLLSDPAR